MNKIMMIVVIFISFVYFCKAQDNLFYVKPAGGEVLINETSCTISFANSSTFTEFDIYLWNGSSCSWTTIAESVESNTYAWDIDQTSFGDMFRLKIQNSNDANDYAFCTGYFSIIEPPDEFSAVDEAITESPELHLYPNPASNSLNIELQGNLIRSVYFWALSGRLVFTLRNIHQPSCKTNLSDLPAGEFFVECYSVKNVRYVRKLVIER